MDRNARVYVAGHRGLVGSAIQRVLTAQGFTNLLVADREDLDLRDQAAVTAFFRETRPEYVFLVAGTVGGILANIERPAEFIYDNLMIHGNVVHAAYQYGVRKLLYLGSACIYPRLCEQPIREEYLLTGALEPTNEPYAVAKIAGIKLCNAYRRQYGCDFISAMPTNLYGPHDNFDPRSCHVVPALMRRLHETRIAGDMTTKVWGTGNPRRELLHVDDLAEACLFLMQHYSGDEHVNVGTGLDVSIRELAERLRAFIHPKVRLRFDSSIPDGTPRRLLDVSRIHALGWKHRISLDSGLRSTYEWFQTAVAGGSDMDGIALTAIQGLLQQLNELGDQNLRLRERLEAIEQGLE